MGLLTKLVEAKAVQGLAAGLGFSLWLKALIARHDASTLSKSKRIFRRGKDPFAYEKSPYERERFDAMESLLGERRFERSLEIGCAEGVFTARLAARSAGVVCVDLSQEALDRAKARVKAGAVDFVQANARTWQPEGSFDLIVFGDFLYYLGDPRKGPAFESALEDFVERSAAWLRPGGALLIANGYGTDSDLGRNEDYVARYERRGLRRAKRLTTGQGAHDKGGMRCLVDLLEKPL